ncbi:MAG: hypothetical protein K5855_06995 [Oscillospiraceae bacterium]|nr:hypothetical protein [Oscillospiraceae bacterium]
MLHGKYVSDYTLQNTLAPDGRQRTVSVYGGPVFRFVKKGAELRRARLRLVVYTAICLLALMAILLLPAPSLHMWYVLPPLAFALLPAAGVAACAVTLTAKNTLERRQKDKRAGGLRPRSAVLAVLALLSLAGQAVYMLGAGGAGLDAAVGICTLVTAACAIRIFFLGKDFVLEEEKNEAL